MGRRTSKPYWIRITPNKQCGNDIICGKWVVYLRRNFSGIKKHEYHELLKKIQSIVDRNCLSLALAKLKNLEVINFFTTTDRYQIWRVKKDIIKELSIKESDLIWKAEYETEIDWVEGKGKLWFLDQILYHLENKDKALKQGRINKAKNIQNKAINPLISRFHKILLEESVMNRRSMVITPVFSPIEYEIDPTIVFVIMPFTEKWSGDVLKIIKDAAKGLPLKIIRADDIFAPAIFVNNIWKMINLAGLIIADISVNNANVFYELGIAHTIGKKVILIRQKNGESPPSDVSLWRYFEYGLLPGQVREFKKLMRKLLSNYYHTIK